MSILPLSRLKALAQDALAYLGTQPDISEAEVFVSANTNLTLRLNYTSRIPSNGVEEPKSVESYGLGLRVAFNSPEGVKTGFGSEPTDLNLEGVRRALDKARMGAVLDPDYVSLPHPTGRKPTLRRYHDPAIMRISNGKMLEVGWETVEKALEVFTSSEELLNAASSPQGVKDIGLILGGDVVMLQERIAIASTHMPKVQTDESTMLMAFVTGMLEDEHAKGTGWHVSSYLADYSGQPGRDAARSAIATMGGQRAGSGAYRVVLGPQAFTEILEWVLMPSLQLDVVYAGASTFMGKVGQRVASEELYLYDDGSMPGLAASRAITDEGVPTGRTDLIRDGVLVGFLSNYYEQQRMLRDPKGGEKLGVDPASIADAIAGRNGFRTGRGGGRNFDAMPSITPTNLVIEGKTPRTPDDVLRQVGDGIYIGRIWYTYPVNGIAAGDFSGTIVGDSYFIKDGRIAAPIKPNTLRMNENIHNVLNNILAVGSERTRTVRWSSDQVTWAPEVAVDDFHLDEIAGYMEDVY
ncbi:MAG: TldD/PmbA family protein [Dehalococcoidia bacterium]|nr:TldD/PmbA family protein [Dehalococcoidia bacterium]